MPTVSQSILTDHRMILLFKQTYGAFTFFYILFGIKSWNRIPIKPSPCGLGEVTLHLSTMVTIHYEVLNWFDQCAKSSRTHKKEVFKTKEGAVEFSGLGLETLALLWALLFHLLLFSATRGSLVPPSGLPQHRSRPPGLRRLKVSRTTIKHSWPPLRELNTWSCLCVIFSSFPQ